MNRNLWEKIGTSLFLIGWILIISYVTSPLWQGHELQEISDPTKAGILITDLPGGEAFAFHQKSKQGDVPRVLELTNLPAKGFLVLLSWKYNWSLDSRWSPGLLQYDEKQFLYALGEQTPSRMGKAGGRPVPTTHVMRLPWKGNLNERVYSISKDTRYFLLLPQNDRLGTHPYSIELRNRDTGAQQSIYLLLGMVALVGGTLILIVHSRKKQTHTDPIESARTYMRWKRFAQARQILQDGLRKQPNRKAEFEAVLHEIVLAENSAEPGRVMAPSHPWQKYAVVLSMLAIAYIAYSIWSGFQQNSDQTSNSQRQLEKSSSQQRLTQTLLKLPKDAVSFALQDSQWAFAAMGRGRVRADATTLTIDHDTLRVLQLADCPSDACRPIRSMQWLLVVPQTASEPDGAWTAVAKSSLQTIDFRPTERNAQHLVSGAQVPMRVEREFDIHQARLILQLTAEGGITTYSRSQQLWPATSGSTEPNGSQHSATSSSKGQQSLYAALYYADAAATREHLKAGASVRERYENDASATHVAAFSGCAECLDALKAAGADLNDKVSTFRQETPLMMAIRNKQVAAARRLIELGANPCITDREGYDAMGWVKFYKLESLFPFISACSK